MYGVDYQAHVSTRASEWEREVRTLQLNREVQLGARVKHNRTPMPSGRFAWLTHPGHVVASARRTRSA